MIKIHKKHTLPFVLFLILVFSLFFIFHDYQYQRKDRVENKSYFQHGKFALSRRDYLSAKRFLKEALSDPDEALEAHFLLGVIYLNGLGGEADIAAGLAELEPLIAAQDPRALLEAGVIYSQKNSPHFDQDKAFSFFTLAAEKGDTQSMRNLGVLFAQEESFDKEKAVFWLEKARAHGCVEASFLLAVHKIDWHDYTDLKQEILPLLEEAAEKNHTPALLALAALHWRYSHQVGEPEKAGEYLKKAAQRSDEGAYRYSLWLEEYPDKKKESEKWLDRAAANDFAPAQFMLGLKLEQGARGPDLGSLAVSWYEKAAAQEHRRALNRLGVIYHRGLYNTGADPRKAIEYFKAASDSGLPEAQNNLALMLIYAQQPDYATAKKLIEKAAAQGYGPAKRNLKLLKNTALMPITDEKSDRVL